MTDATLRRLINSGDGYNIARAWLGYKATSELKLKTAEPPLKTDEGMMFEAVYKLEPDNRMEFQKACSVYDDLRYNNQLAMAQLQHAGRRCEELKRRIDLAWMFEVLKPKSHAIRRDYYSPSRYSFDNYWLPLCAEDKRELRDDAQFFYDTMIVSLNYVKAYNEAVRVVEKYYKVPEISENWLQYDPTDEIVTEYRKSRARLIQHYTSQLPSKTAQRRLKEFRRRFPDVKFGLIDVPKYKIKEGAKRFTNSSVSLPNVISLFNSTI